MSNHRKKLRGGDARSDQYGLTDTPANKALLAANIAMAIANPITGIPLLAGPIIYSALSEIADADDAARAAHYDKYYRARDDYNREVGRERSQKHFSAYEAAHEMYLMRQAIVPVLLTELDVDREIAMQERNMNVNASNLAAYTSKFSQDMINNNMALQQQRNTALTQQSRQRISSIQAQTAALRATAASKAEVLRQQQQEYMKAVSSKKEVMRQQDESYQNNLNRTQTILSTQNNIVQQNQLANQQMQEKMAQTAAARALPVASQAAPRQARRLPPPVLLSNR